MFTQRMILQYQKSIVRCCGSQVKRKQNVTALQKGERKMCEGTGKRDTETGCWISAEEMKENNTHEAWLEQEMVHYKFYHIFWCRWDEDNRWYSPKDWLPNLWTWFYERAEYRSNGGISWKIVQVIWSIQEFIDCCITILEWDRPPHAEHRGLYKGDWKTKWGFWEFVYAHTIRKYIDKMLILFKEKVLGIEEVDDHLVCPSWPNCDIDPNGCRVEMGDDVEWYGYRD